MKWILKPVKSLFSPEKNNIMADKINNYTGIIKSKKDNLSPVIIIRMEVLTEINTKNNEKYIKKINKLISKIHEESYLTDYHGSVYELNTDNAIIEIEEVKTPVSYDWNKYKDMLFPQISFDTSIEIKETAVYVKEVKNNEAVIITGKLKNNTILADKIRRA